MNTVGSIKNPACKRYAICDIRVGLVIKHLLCRVEEDENRIGGKAAHATHSNKPPGPRDSRLIYLPPTLGYGPKSSPVLLSCLQIRLNIQCGSSSLSARLEVGAALRVGIFNIACMPTRSLREAFSPFPQLNLTLESRTGRP